MDSSLSDDDFSFDPSDHYLFPPEDDSDYHDNLDNPYYYGDGNDGYGDRD